MNPAVLLLSASLRRTLQGLVILFSKSLISRLPIDLHSELKLVAIITKSPIVLLPAADQGS